MENLFFEKSEYGVRLMSDGKPVLLRSGELHNSSSTSRAYMEPVWKPLRDLGLNCVIAPIPWDLFEPEEGTYDFSIPSYLIKDAEQNGMKLILIWFASWKNAESYYVPEWVQTNLERFPRALNAEGKQITSLSCFSEENRNIDARAFAKLMEFISKADQNHTVLMMQVENECGHLGPDRDYCAAANEHFKEAVPEELRTYLKERRTALSPFLNLHITEKLDDPSADWKAVFGKGAEECFMGYYLAKYIGYVIAEGKKQHDIPMFVNSWLFQAVDEPAGKHPAGGPTPEINDIWYCAAPEIAAAAPDLYLMPRFVFNCLESLRPEGKPLLIPEMHVDHYAPGSLLCGAGLGAVCLSPFGIDELAMVYAKDPSAQLPVQVKQTYDIIQSCEFNLLHSKPENRVGFVQSDSLEEDLDLDHYHLHIKYLREAGVNAVAGGGFVIRTGENMFLVAGINVYIQISDLNARSCEVVFMDEYFAKDGELIRGRRMCGDEMYLYFTDNPGICMVRYFSHD